MLARFSPTIITLAAIGFLCGPGLAHADGMPRAPRAYSQYAEPTYQPYDWSGFYLGGHVGGVYSATDWLTGTLEEVEHSSTNFVGGAHLGLQKQWGRTVLGVEVAYSWLDAAESSTSVFLPGTTFSSDVRNLLTVVGRLGFAYENILAYTKAGYASADVELGAAAAGLTASSSEREHGWTAGLGVEYGITGNISIGIEYNYLHFNAGGATLVGVQVGDADVDLQTVVARLNFKFGGHGR